MFVFFSVIGVLFLTTSCVAGITSKIKLRQGEAFNFYASDDLSMTNKIHHIVSAEDCLCTEAVEVQKNNQLDYVDSLGLLFSYSFYIHSGSSSNPCPINSDQVRNKTPLAINIVHETQRHEFDYGLALRRGLHDFTHASYIKNNSQQIFQTDKSGGILFTRKNVQFRPCLLFPWFMPWIYTYEGTSELIELNFSLNATPSLGDYEIRDMLYLMQDVVTSSGYLKEKHVANLKDNNGVFPSVKAFEFQALFIPHRFTEEFQTLLGVFEETDISASYYIPFIYQAMFDRNEWLFFSKVNQSEVIQLNHMSLLKECSFEKSKVNTEVADELYNFGFSKCGGAVAAIDRIIYQIKTVHVYPTWPVIALLVWFLIIFCLLYLLLFGKSERVLNARIYFRKRFKKLCSCTESRYAREESYVQLVSTSSFHEMSTSKKEDAENSDDDGVLSL